MPFVRPGLSIFWRLMRPQLVNVLSAHYVKTYELASLAPCMSLDSDSKQRGGSSSTTPDNIEPKDSQKYLGNGIGAWSIPAESIIDKVAVPLIGCRRSLLSSVLTAYQVAKPRTKCVILANGAGTTPPRTEPPRLFPFNLYKANGGLQAKVWYESLLKADTPYAVRRTMIGLLRHVTATEAAR